MRRGQTTVEYMLAIAVIAVALAAVMGVLWSSVADSTDELAQDMADELSDGEVQ